MIVTSQRRQQIINRLCEIANDLSGIPVDSLKHDVSFLDLGFDSLFLTQLSAAYQKEFRVRITFRQLFDDLSTLAALSAYIESNTPQEVVPEVKRPAEPAPPVPTVLPIPVPAIAAAPRIEPARAGGLEAVILQQLDLMTEQLRLLESLPATAAIPSELPPVQPAVETAAPKTTPVQLPSGFGPGDSKNSGLHSLPPAQQRHLDTLIENYTKRTAGSKQRTQRYRSVLADPRTAAGFNRRWKEMTYPIWVERSLGSKLWDVDGNKYVDMLNGFGPHFLGHSPAYVTKALEEQLRRGFEIGPQTPLVGEAAEMICRLTGMDRASFTCSGSEAVQAAMRLSRTVTGRDKVVLFSRDYHGNFDQVLVRDANRNGKLRTVPSAPGIPLQSVDDTYVMDYGTEESLELIKKHADEIAAVLVEPVQSRRPDFQPREFLHELRRITREAGILLIFDEVVTGFRAAPGGAQAYFGIDADLATYGKILGGGMPIGVVAGRAGVMDTFDGGFWQYGDDSFPQAGVTFFAGTFVRHPLAIAATHAVLTYLIEQGPALQERVAAKATRLAEHANNLFRKYEIDIELPYFTSQMYLRIKEHGELANLLYFHLRYRGVHILEGFPCYMTDAHTDQDIEHVANAFTESVESMVEAGIFGNAAKLSQPDSPAAVGALPSISSSAVKYPPSDAQREMWVAAQMSQEASAASYGSNVVELVGELNVPALELAIAEVIKRHEALRSTFAPDGAEIVVKPSMTVELRQDDLSDVLLADRDLRVSQILNEEVRQVFDFAAGPLLSFRLIRLSPNHHLLAFTAHMIVCDGWGFKVVLEELGACYSAAVEGREPLLAAANQMREYVSWQRQERGSEAAAKCESFWLSQFKTLPPPFELPGLRLRPPVRTFDAARENLRIGPEFCVTLKRAAKQLRNTPFALLLAAYQIWLHRLSGEKDLVVAVPFAGQGALGLNTLVGQCVHTLPFRIKVDPAASFASHLMKTRSLILDAQENWSSNIGPIVQRLAPPSDPSRLPLASVMFNLDPPLTDVRFFGCASRVTSGPRYTYHYDLGFNVVDEGDAFLVECDYNSALFDGETIRHWLNGFQVMLEGVVADPETHVSRLPILNEAERRRRSGKGIAESRDSSVEQAIHEWISSQAGRAPDSSYTQIVDDRLEPVPVGVPGELLLAVGEESLCRTGNVARYLPDGRIEFLGRQDRQIRLRGYRINLDAIEAVLSSHPQVRDAAIVVRNDPNGPSREPRLAAYLVLDESSGPAEKLLAEVRSFCRKKLPVYMLPAVLVEQPALPRKLNGELDADALPALSPADWKRWQEEDYTAPRNPVEERLARLWSETLKIERVSVTANFFDLGGQSLLAVALFGKIEKEFGRRLPLATLFTSPTIEDLAKALAVEDVGTPWPSLLPIQPKGTKPPLFLVHGAGGNVLLYRGLGERLAPDYPLYGLQSQGLDGRSAPLRTIEEMAAFYLREVREVQPQGPYYLGGYCLGGTVAYEMAQILRGQGEKVALVAMLDTYNFSRALKVSFHSFLFQKLKFHLANFAHLRPREMFAYLKEKARQLLEGELANLKTSRPGASQEAGVARATSGVEASIQAINDYAAEAYIPRGYPGEIALFKPRFNYKFYPDPNMGWGDLALGGLDIVEVAVNPHSMLLEPYVQVLAQQLKERIDGASSSQTVLHRGEEIPETEPAAPHCIAR